MTNIITNDLRKAAVLIRSLDADSAAALLAQLSPNEAQTLRAEMRKLGPLDIEEQSDVAAEFRRGKSIAAEDASFGVELELSSIGSESSMAMTDRTGGTKRFKFLDDAPVGSLIACLSREHVQTIAVVLSYLPPARAADVLAGLPGRLQADVLQRLSNLGETDPDSLKVIEHELASWVAWQRDRHQQPEVETNTVANILAAAGETARECILANLRGQSHPLAEVVSSRVDQREPVGEVKPPVAEASSPIESLHRYQAPAPTPAPIQRVVPPAPPIAPPAIDFEFDELVHLDLASLSAVMRQTDADVLALALAGSSDELVERIASQMPRRVAKEFRRQLRQLGPTRLSDVELAKRAVARVAGEMAAAQSAVA